MENSHLNILIKTHLLFCHCGIPSKNIANSSFSFSPGRTRDKECRLSLDEATARGGIKNSCCLTYVIKIEEATEESRYAAYDMPDLVKRSYQQKADYCQAEMSLPEPSDNEQFMEESRRNYINNINSLICISIIDHIGSYEFSCPLEKYILFLNELSDLSTATYIQVHRCFFGMRSHLLLANLLHT